MQPVSGKIWQETYSWWQGRRKKKLGKEIPVDGVPFLRHWRCGLISCYATGSIQVGEEL